MINLQPAKAIDLNNSNNIHVAEHNNNYEGKHYYEYYLVLNNDIVSMCNQLLWKWLISLLVGSLIFFNN